MTISKRKEILLYIVYLKVNLYEKWKFKLIEKFTRKVLVFSLLYFVSIFVPCTYTCASFTLPLFNHYTMFYLPLYLHLKSEDEKWRKETFLLCLGKNFTRYIYGEIILLGLSNYKYGGGAKKWAYFFVAVEYLM